MEQEGWREKCVEEFNLKPIPDEWKDQVARGSERAWKSYYKFRSELERTKKKRREDNGDEWEDDEGRLELLKDWEDELETLEDEIFFVPEQRAQRGDWPSYLYVGRLAWEDYDEIRTAHFYSYVWSPFAIPHAIQLEHCYHRHPRWSTMEFGAVWGYRLVDFEEGSPEENDEEKEERFTTLCSNCYEDEELRADVIDTSGLNTNTTNKLRRFLYGAGDESKVYCDDFSFLRLLFGSMGTFEYETLKGGWIGYEWSLPYKDEDRMVAQGVIGKNECAGISWLEHKMRQVAGALRPIDNYYKPPTIKDAPGYNSPEGDY